MVVSRLQGLVSLVPLHGKVADVGAGDGHLAKALVQRGNPFVLCTEANEGPFEGCVRRMGPWGVPVRFGYGLDPVFPFEVDLVVLAGMGAPTIEGILGDREKRSTFSVFLLQPMFGIFRLRRYLYEEGLGIMDEGVFYERGRFYPWIQMVPRRIPLCLELCLQYPNVPPRSLHRFGPRLLLKKDEQTLRYFRFLSSYFAREAKKRREDPMAKKDRIEWKRVMECL